MILFERDLLDSAFVQGSVLRAAFDLPHDPSVLLLDQVVGVWAVDLRLNSLHHEVSVNPVSVDILVGLQALEGLDSHLLVQLVFGVGWIQWFGP